jgi:benzoate 4-monooxygenase
VFGISGILVWLLSYTVGRFIKDPKHLRRFPAPSFAAFSPIWSMWYSWHGIQYKAIDAAHQRLGPVVRIAPNHLSFTDPAAYKDIYGHGNPLVKDDFYDHLGAGNPSMAQAVDKIIHSAKRRNLSHVFAAKQITAMEPRVMVSVDRLCSALRVKAMGGKVGPHDSYEVVDRVFDLRPWLNMLSYDAISSMFFTNEYNFLEKGSDLCPSLDEMGNVKTVHAMDTFHSASIFNSTFAQLPRPLYTLSRKVLWFIHGNQSGSDFAGMSRAQVRRRVAIEPPTPDLFSYLPYRPTEKRPIPMPLEEMVAECATMLDAGNDTTQTSLVNCIFQLAKHKEKQKKLYDALAGVAPVHIGNRVLPASALQDLTYLRAVLDESWRCLPPVARGLPRRTTGEGARIDGHFIPAGVTVSAPIHTLHHNEKLFRKAHEFIPERWIPEEPFGQDEVETQNLKSYSIPFSMGPRACIGRNLAYMEISITVAALILNFEWELAGTEQDMDLIERFNRNPRFLKVRATPR